MTDIVERLNDSLSAGYSELRKEAAVEIMRLRAKIEAMERQDCSKQSMPAEVSREFVMDAIAQALGDAYDCTRVWSAWGYGTMSHDDFQLIAEDGDRLREIADAAIMAMGASAPKPCAQPAQSVPNLDMDALERQNDEMKEEVGRLRDALALIADQYEPKCNLLIPSIARSALCATGAYGQTEAQPTPNVPDGWQLVPIEPTSEMVKACASAARAYMQEYGGNSPQVMWAAMLAAAPEAKP